MSSLAHSFLMIAKVRGASDSFVPLAGKNKNPVAGGELPIQISHWNNFNGQLSWNGYLVSSLARTSLADSSHYSSGSLLGLTLLKYKAPWCYNQATTPHDR